MTSTVQEDAWVDAERDYKLGLRAGKLVCQNPKGKSLASVPKWLKETDTAESLLALADWLAEHELECLHTVERWMLRSLSIPRAVVTEIWADSAWRDCIENMVVVPVAAGGAFDLENAGLLKDVDAKRGLGVIDLDGETQWIKTDSFGVPHPILIGDLEELRELAGDLGIRQAIDQLYRPIHQPTQEQLELTSINDFSGGHFEQLNFATSHCRRLPDLGKQRPDRGSVFHRRRIPRITNLDGRIGVRRRESAAAENQFDRSGHVQRRRSHGLGDLRQT